MLWWCREKRKEKDESFDFAKRGKAREGECLKFFPAVMLSSGCGTSDLRERKREREKESRWWCGEREQRGVREF